MPGPTPSLVSAVLRRGSSIRFREVTEAAEATEAAEVTAATESTWSPSRRGHRGGVPNEWGQINIDAIQLHSASRRYGAGDGVCLLSAPTTVEIPWTAMGAAVGACAVLAVVVGHPRRTRPEAPGGGPGRRSGMTPVAHALTPPAPEPVLTGRVRP